MSEYPHERAAGNHAEPARGREEAQWEFLVYSTGLGVAIVLTALSFWAANTTLLWPPGVPLGLAVLAIAQMGVHLVFFIHITTGPDNTNNVLALAFGVLIVLLLMVGSLWIMTNLNQNMSMLAPS
jgi:cytochrome o ubiquinol oxidase subunit IV